MNVCYILDGILVLYALILTVLYCRLKMRPAHNKPIHPPEKQPVGGNVYAGLTIATSDIYETITTDKKSFV